MTEVSEDRLRQKVRDLLSDVDPVEATQYEFRGAQFDRGLSRFEFPEGERVLGLPKEPGVDKNTPWSEIPRN